MKTDLYSPRMQLSRGRDEPKMLGQILCHLSPPEREKLARSYDCSYKKCFKDPLHHLSMKTVCVYTLFAAVNPTFETTNGTYFGNTNWKFYRAYYLIQISCTSTCVGLYLPDCLYIRQIPVPHINPIIHLCINQIIWPVHRRYVWIVDGSRVAESVQSLTTDWTTGVRSPAEVKDFSSSFCVQTSSEVHPASCPTGTVGPFPGDKARPGRDANHSPPSSAEVKNE
jgi:hypothetical protein